MEAIVAAIEEQHRALGDLLAGLHDEDWQRPSWCDGWTVADVVLHLAQTDELATASVAGTFEGAVGAIAGAAADAGPPGDVDAAAGAWVAAERGPTGEALLARWQASAAALRSRLAATDPSARVPWVAGHLAARTLATTRLAECWIHTCDVAWAFGGQPERADRLRHVARLAWRTLPHAFARAGEALSGPVAFDLTGPSGDRWTFAPDGEEPATVVRGDAVELCLVAGRRLPAAETSLTAEGPDGARVLELVRTFA